MAVCGEWEDAGVVLATQECRRSVYGELRPACLEAAQAEGGLHAVAVFDVGREAVERGRKLAPL